jgi:equilibrative nucleoside transporter 1/2/3
MILASSPTLNPKISDEEKDIAGTLAAFCLVAGLAGGSICSFGVNWLVGGNVMG